VTIVHISTELRLAWRRGLEAALAAEPDNLVPYQLFREADVAMRKVVTNRLTLFSQLSQGRPSQLTENSDGQHKSSSSDQRLEGI
jgi:fructose-bisphosphate aldolase class II